MHLAAPSLSYGQIIIGTLAIVNVCRGGEALAAISPHESAYSANGGHSTSNVRSSIARYAMPTWQLA
jgi:hypothetical protein